MSKYAQSALKISDRGGDQSHSGVGLKILGDGGGTGLHGVGHPLDGGGSPPPSPPYWETLGDKKNFRVQNYEENSW